MKTSTFTVFGERCSGTNHATAWLEANAHLAFNKEFGWRHEIMPVKEVQNATDTLAFSSWATCRIGSAAFISRRVETILDHTMETSIRDRDFGSLMGREIICAIENSPTGWPLWPWSGA